MSGGGMVVLSPTNGIPPKRHVTFAADVRDTTPDPIQEARKIARQGNRYRAKDDYVSALERYNGAIALLERNFGSSPEDDDARLLLAKVYMLVFKLYFVYLDNIENASFYNKRARELEVSNLCLEKL